MKQQIQKIVVGAALFRDNKILIVKRSKKDTFLPGIWELPGGKVEFNESAEKALLRETKEETGLEITESLPVNTFSYIVEKENATIHSIQINFIARTKNLDVKLSEEHEDFVWISEEKIENYNITPEIRNVIKDAFSNKMKLNPCGDKNGIKRTDHIDALD